MTLPEQSDINEPLTMDDLLKAYAVTLQAYDDAEHRFRADPTALNVSTLHRWLDRLVYLRDEIGRSTRLSDAIRGADMEPVRKMLAKITAEGSSS